MAYAGHTALCIKALLAFATATNLLSLLNAAGGKPVRDMKRSFLKPKKYTAGMRETANMLPQ